MVPVKLKNNTVKNMCIDCVVDSVSWCICCGEAFENNPDDKVRLCNDCQYELFHECN
jgi:hypothetical protein